jgi:hypothetical protein
MKYLISVAMLFFTLTVGATTINISDEQEKVFNKIKQELLNNKDVGTLEVNYVYTNIIKIIDSIQSEVVPESLIKDDFNFILEYTEEITKKVFTTNDKENLWLYINNHGEKSKKQLLKIKDSFLGN